MRRFPSLSRIGGGGRGWLCRCCAAIDWYIPYVRGIMGSGGSYVLKFIEGAVDVVIYGDFDVAFSIVPFRVESAVKGAVPFNCAFIVVLDCVYEVVCVVLV